MQLKRDIVTYHGYNTFMAEAVLDLFSPAEALEFLEANEVRCLACLLVCRASIPASCPHGCQWAGLYLC